MASKLEIDSLTIRNSGNIFSSTLDGNVGDFVWSGSYLYICVAENSWKRVAVASWSAPDQVTGLTADSVGDTTIDLSWNAPSSDDPITDYIIEYTTGQNTLTVFVGSNTTSYQLTNLVADSEYSIRVAAISSAGTGTYSVTITETPGLFDPASITGLHAWWDAADAVLSGSSVTSWPSRVGNFSLTASTGNPTFSANGFNGHPQVEFDGNAAMRSASAVLTRDVSDGVSIVAVVRPSAVPSSTPDTASRYAVLGGESTNTLGHYLSLRVFNADKKYNAAITKAGVADDVALSSSLVAVERKLHAITFDATTVTNYLNDSPSGTASVSAASSATAHNGFFSLGGLYFNGSFLAGFFAEVDMAELLIYDRALTAAEMTALYDYYNLRYSFE